MFHSRFRPRIRDGFFWRVFLAFSFPDIPCMSFCEAIIGNECLPTSGITSVYLDWLRDAAHTHGCAIHAYVLMPNHIHLLATPGHEQSLPKTLQSLGRRYVQYFNQTHDRTGTLWEGRYRATLVDAEAYLLTCYRYIEGQSGSCGERDPSESLSLVKLSFSCRRKGRPGSHSPCLVSTAWAGLQKNAKRLIEPCFESI